jgi:hypothetical protein
MISAAERRRSLSLMSCTKHNSEPIFREAGNAIHFQHTDDDVTLSETSERAPLWQSRFLLRSLVQRAEGLLAYGLKP